MLSKIEDEELTDRLKNWGRAIADHKVSRTSPLYFLRVSASIASGQRPGGVPVLFDIDYRDADIVQKAWRKLPEMPERYRKAKQILVLWFACPQLTRWMVSKHLHVSDSKLDALLMQGTVLIWDALMRLQAQDVQNTLDSHTR